MKTCSKCKKTLSLYFFDIQLSVKDLHQRWCKSCCKEYRKQNKDKERIRQRKCYWKNHKIRLNQNNLSYWKNREKYRKQRAIYSLENKELLNEKWRKWAKNNKDYLKTAKACRKALINKNGGFFTKEEWIFLKKKYDNKCLACGREAELTPDHIIPLAKGGTSFIHNIQPLCRSCNCSKRAEIIDYREEVYDQII